MNQLIWTTNLPKTEDGVEFHFAREAPEMHGAHLDGATVGLHVVFRMIGIYL